MSNSSIEQVKHRKPVIDNDIVQKDQRWHCRNRITLVFGSNDIENLETYIYSETGLEFKTVQFHQAKSKAIEEILDNSIDEYYRGYVTEIHTKLSEDGTVVSIQDNGIGFPLDKIVPVYTEFRTGSKFKDEELDENGFLYRSLGQNGLGASATCLTSDYFKATVRHYKSKQEQTVEFLDGTNKIKKGKAKPFKGHSGVSIELTLSKQVYKDNVIDKDLLRKRIIDLAYNNPGLTFYFNGERYQFKKGLFELAQRIDMTTAQVFGDEEFVYEIESHDGRKLKGKIDFNMSLVINKSTDERERFISFVNSTPTFDGGFHHDRIRRFFINAMKEKLERELKREKMGISDNDVLAGLTFIVGITMPNPRFESQTKRKLVRDLNLEKGIDRFMSENIERFLRKNRDYLDLVIERCKNRYRFEELKEASLKGKKQKRQRVEKLLDANERKHRENCALFLCEGDSAIGGLRSARNKLTQGGIALKGKPMNVSQASIKEILDNQEFSDIMASIGLTIGQPVSWENLRYSKIVFLADSDVDGGHINTLLTNFFFTFWPELFEKGAVQIAKAPLFEIETDKGPIYAESDSELAKLQKDGIKVKAINRNKGLGEMSEQAWRHVLSRGDYTKIMIDDATEAKNMLNVCFGKDSAPRKDLLMDSNNSGEQISVEKDGKQMHAKKSEKKEVKKEAKPEKASKTPKATKKKAAKK